MGTYYDVRWIFKTYLGIYSGKEQKVDAIKSGMDNHISNQRNDFAQKLSNKLIKQSSFQYLSFSI